jgi:glutamate-1-semialdehyde 2,1-aminomutase
MIAPEGPVYQAGTLSGNPLAMAAGAAALDALAAPGVYERIEATARRLAEGLVTLVGPRAAVVQQGALLTLFFASPTATHVPTHSLGAPPADYEAVRNADSEAFRRFFHAMLARGILLPPSPFEAWFTTLAHGDEEVDLTLEAARFALAEALG